MAKLTKKQQLFIKEYLVDLNATQAAIRAGYSENTARVIGGENLLKPAILSEIQAAFDKRSEKVEITADYVLTSLKDVAERCMQEVPVMKHGVNGMEETGQYKFDSSGANKSLELLGKHLKLFRDQLDIVHDYKDMTDDDIESELRKLEDDKK